MSSKISTISFVCVYLLDSMYSIDSSSPSPSDMVSFNALFFYYSLISSSDSDDSYIEVALLIDNFYSG